MNPVASVFSSIAPLSVFGPSAVDTAVPLLTDIGMSPLAAGGSSTIVELSGLGQTLSALFEFQTRLPPASASDFAGVSAQAQGLVDAFNTLQGRLADVAGATGEPVSAQLAQDLGTAAQGIFNGASALSRLSQVGITFQPAAFGIGGTLTLDSGQLQAAFAADNGGTEALLAAALQVFSGLAARYASPGGAIPGALVAAEQAAAFSTLLSGTTAGIGASTLADLLVLESSGAGFGLGSQQIMALEEFLMVDSLLGSTTLTSA